jgi:hypothetical protein
MRAPTVIVRFLQWRWTPSVLLVVGSLVFVGIVVLIVPDDFDSVTSGADRVSRAAARGRAAKNVESVTDPSLPSAGEDDSPTPLSERRTAALPKRGHNIVQSIFHPIQKPELPVEPVDPNPQPPPPPPPPAPPTATIYTLENSPPAPPNPLAVPGAPTAEGPIEPQGITGDRQ